MQHTAMLVHWKMLRADRTSQLDNVRHPGLSGQLEARMVDTMSPRVLFHVVGPTLHRQAQVEDAAVTQHMQLEKDHPLSLPE